MDGGGGTAAPIWAENLFFGAKDLLCIKNFWENAVNYVIEVGNICPVQKTF